MLLGDEDAGERAAAHRGGREQVAVGLGGGQRRFGQRRVGVDPGGEQARPVQGALDRGGLGVADPVGEPDELPERGARALVPAGRAQVTGGRRVVLLGGDGVAFGAQVRQPLADLPQLRFQVRAGGDGAACRSAMRPSYTSVRLAAPGSPMRSSASASASASSGPDARAGPAAGPAGGPGGQFGRGRLAGLRQAGRRGRAGLFLALARRSAYRRDPARVGRVWPGVPDRLQQPADLADVVAAGGDPGPGRQQQVVAGIDRAEAVVGDAGPLGGVGQVGGDTASARRGPRRRGGRACAPRSRPRRARGGPGRAGCAGPRPRARRPATSRRLSSIRPCALYSSEFFSPARRPCSVSPSSRLASRSRLGLPLGLDRAAVARGRFGDLLRVLGRRVGPGLHPVQLEPHMGPQVGGVVGEEVLDGRVGRGEVVEQLLHRGEVLEVARGLLYQVRRRPGSVPRSACPTPWPGRGPWPAAGGAARAAGQAAGRTAPGRGRTAGRPPGPGTRSRSCARRPVRARPAAAVRSAGGSPPTAGRSPRRAACR